jgi:dolichyl-phosphate-mannose-protein mannosyltransferase
MANRTASNQYLSEKPQSRRSGKSPSRSPARSPARSPVPNGRKQQKTQQVLGYQSEGVQDHDIFNLPGSDWSLLGLLTVVASVVRMFRIAQPSSVVFDEVQYVDPIGM